MSLFALDMQEVTDAKFGDQFADEDEHFPHQAFVSGSDSRKQTASEHSFSVGRRLQQNSVLDNHLIEEQQKKVLSGSARYRAMQVCN